MGILFSSIIGKITDSAGSVFVFSVINQLQAVLGVACILGNNEATSFHIEARTNAIFHLCRRY